MKTAIQPTLTVMEHQLLIEAIFNGAFAAANELARMRINQNQDEAEMYGRQLDALQSAVRKLVYAPESRTDEVEALAKALGQERTRRQVYQDAFEQLAAGPGAGFISERVKEKLKEAGV